MRKRSIIMTGFAAVVLMAFVSACATAPKPTQQNFQTPMVTLDSVELPYYTGWWYFSNKVKPTKGDAGNYGAPLGLAFVFSIDNPNSYPVMLDGFKFTIAFDEFDVNTVMASETQWIPAGKTNQIRVNATFDARAALLSLMVTGGFKLKAQDMSPWDALEKWWRGVSEYTIPITVKEGAAVFKAGGVTNVVAFDATFS